MIPKILMHGLKLGEAEKREGAKAIEARRAETRIALRRARLGHESASRA